MSNALFAPLYRMESFVRAAAALKSGKKTLLVSGAADTAKIHIAAALADELCAPVLFITSSELKAKSAAEDFSFFFPTHHYPAKDIIFYSADVKSFDIIKQRFSFINGLLNGAGFCAALSVESAFDVLSPRKVFQDFITTYKVGDEIKIADLAEKLVKTGYERAKEADAPGRFSVRGGIVDVYPILAAQACRIEFFDDTIDSLRALDSYGQRSVENIDKLEIFPTRELVYNEEILKGAIQKLEKSYNKARKNFLSEDLIEEAENLLSSVGSDIEKLKEDKTCPNVDKYVAFFGEEKTTLIDYLPPETIIVFDEPARTAQHAENVLREFTESAQARISHGYALPKQIESVVSYNELLQRTKRFRQVILTAMSCTVHDFTIDEICSFDVKSQQTAGLPNLREDLSYYNSAGYFAVVLAGGKTRAERLTEELNEYGLSAQTANLKEETADFETEKGGIVVTGGSLSNGFEYPLIKFVILSNTDAAAAKKKRSKGKKSGKIDSFLDLKIGDYVVHDNYGVGIYRGIEKTIVDGISRDYLKISYAAGGNLYVSIHQLSSLQKYIGNSDDGKVKLSKLGSGDWQKAKARVRGAVAILAKDLAEFYAKRQSARGFVFGEDTVWQKEFEEEFPFDETDDQLAAIEDTKRDMESIKVMDRLVCGDVGYGKTEIAVRAAFKAVENGKQVAFLAPTTILVQQHCNTFVQRMKNYPIKIESLSRFRTAKETANVKKGLISGAVDIVIGTHKILAKDVTFKNLGLIVVDEEQRFGVSHKEKLKRFKNNVDVLTLTATPIPRTLHMSLTGIRDMSVLQEPPHERRPVQTYVMEFNPDLTRDAILRELARNGQIYYLHNRIQNISETASKLQKLVPEATVAFAHGQMGENELERVMSSFIEGEIDVLVCTTIIETGLDIPNVNTIIIQDADKMGLSQLYQLRGRVGRSNRLAYAYLMYKKDKVLSEISEKRLQTIREFTEFGSGFKIAMRDLEIRGAGNILGAEQHGHMDAVGYDMYCKLLAEAIEAAKSGDSVTEQKEDFETTVDIQVNAFIPPFYIENEDFKLEIYKKISHILDGTDYSDVLDEITDRFGTPPIAVINLLDVALIKTIAHKAGFCSVTQKKGGIILAYKEQPNISVIAKAAAKLKGRLLFTAGDAPYVTLKQGENVLDDLKEALPLLIG